MRAPESPDFYCNGELTLDNNTREILHEKITEVIATGKKVKIFLDFFSLFYIDVAVFYENNKQFPIHSHWITQIVNTHLVNELALLFHEFGQAHFILEMLFDASPNPMLHATDSCSADDITSYFALLQDGKQKDFLLSLFFSALRAKYPDLQSPESIQSHAIHPEILCTVVKAENVLGDVFYAHSPLYLWNQEYADQTNLWKGKRVDRTEMWIQMQEKVRDTLPDYISRTSWDVVIKRSQYLKYYLQNEKLLGLQYFNIYFNHHKNAIPREEIASLPMVVVGVGEPPSLHQTASYIPRSGMVDRGFEARDRETRRVNKMTSAFFYRPQLPSLRVVRAQQAEIKDSAQVLQKACELMGLQTGGSLAVGGKTLREGGFILKYSLFKLPQQCVDALSRSLRDTPCETPLKRRPRPTMVTWAETVEIERVTISPAAQKAAEQVKIARSKLARAGFVAQLRALSLANKNSHNRPPDCKPAENPAL